MNSFNDTDPYPLLGKRRIAHSSARTGDGGQGNSGHRESSTTLVRRQINHYSGSSIAPIQRNQNTHFPNHPVAEKMVAERGMVVNQNRLALAVALPQNRHEVLDRARKPAVPAIKYKAPAIAARLAHRPKQNPSVNSSLALVPFSNPPANTSLELVPYTGPGSPKRLFDNTTLALDISNEVRHLENRINKFQTRFGQSRTSIGKIGIGCVCKPTPGRRSKSRYPRYIRYSMLASTEPVPPEKTYLAQKYRELNELVGTHGLPDLGFSSPEHESEDMDQSSDSSYSTTTGADSDTDFVPGKRFI